MKITHNQNTYYFMEMNTTMTDVIDNRDNMIVLPVVDGSKQFHGGCSWVSLPGTGMCWPFPSGLVKLLLVAGLVV